MLRRRPPPCAFAALFGCTIQPTPERNPSADSTVRLARPPEPALELGPDRRSDPHLIVFADRISYAYLLLLPPDPPPTPSREDLAALVRASLSTAADEPERDLLLELIRTEPSGPRGPRASANGTSSRAPDLVGLHTARLPIVGPAGAVTATSLGDPILTRELQPDERASLPARTTALLLRAEYRNRYAVRGLRLLQTLVQLVARTHDALIHDPDTGETMGAQAFSRRQLQASLTNVADQIAVVPFVDRARPGHFRLATRGMRRFGSVDIELDGLPRHASTLQRATDLLYGLAVQLVRLGEFDASGYAVELDERVTVAIEDIVAAYGHRGDRGDRVPRCDDCPGEVGLHLVERPAEPHDPADHVVARVVAPREVSDAADYDHVAWVQASLRDLFGPGHIAAP